MFVQNTSPQKSTDAGWNGHTQIREEDPFTNERIIGQQGKYTRKRAKRADYILYNKPNISLAIVEVKIKNIPWDLACSKPLIMLIYWIYLSCLVHLVTIVLYGLSYVKTSI